MPHHTSADQPLHPTFKRPNRNKRGKQPQAQEYTNPNPAWTQSKKWVNPAVREAEDNRKLASLRKNFCPESEDFPNNIAELAKHKREFAALIAARKPAQAAAVEGSIKDIEREHNGEITNTAPKIRPPFNGILTQDGALDLKDVPFAQSFVLCCDTVFTPNYDMGFKPMADWPTKHEAKYEGDERIATDPLHGRFLGAPRVKGNDTVNWQHRNIIPQYLLEDFHQPRTEQDVWERCHWIADLEFGPRWKGMIAEEHEMNNIGDGTGRDIIGWELFDALDPEDKL